MSSLDNQCNFFGNLGKDVDLQYTPKGTAVAKFSLGVNRSVKKGEEWEDETDWVNITAYGKMAERLKNILQKGSLVYVETYYRTFTWKDKETNETRYGHEFVLENFKPLARLQEKEARQTSSSSKSTKNSSKAKDDYEDDDYEDDY